MRTHLRRTHVGIAIAILSLLAVSCPGDGVAQVTVQAVDRAPDGSSADGFSSEASISRNGRFVAFSSAATNLVPNDTNSRADIFVRDLAGDEIILVSLRPNGSQTEAVSYEPKVSGDGRYVVFTTNDDMATDDQNQFPDVYLRDLQTSETHLVSARPDGSAAGGSDPDISANGRWISLISDELTEDDHNDYRDVFVVDLAQQQAHLMTRFTNGKQTNFSVHDSSISDDGQVVAFSGHARLFVYDRSEGKRWRADVNNKGKKKGSVFDQDLAPNGKKVAFSAWSKFSWKDRNDHLDVYVRNFRRRKTRVVSVLPNGRTTKNSRDSLSPAFSGHSAAVAFASDANLTRSKADEDRRDIFVRNLRKGRTRLLSYPCRSSGYPTLPRWGNAVAFSSTGCGGAGSGWIFHSSR